MTARVTTGTRRVGAVFLYVPLVLALIAEAAWIAVFAGLLQAFALHAPVTGVAELLLATIAGVVATRVLGPRLGDRWPRTAVGLAALAGAIGWLASAEVRDLLRAGGTEALGPALAANPGGWLVALAFVRGMAHARLPVDPERIGTLLAAGVPALAVAAIVGGMISEPWRGDFLDAAQPIVLLFLVTGVASLAFARLGEAGGGARLDAARNPAWLLLLGGLVLVSTALAIWVGAVAGSTIATVAGALVVPLLVAGFLVGFDRRTVRILFISLVVAGAIALVLRALSGGNALPLPGGVLTAPSLPTKDEPQSQTGLALGLLGVVLIASVVIVMLLARLWLRRRGGAAVEDDEDRVIDRGGELDDAPRRRVRRFGRRAPAPADAVGAYLALVAALEGRDPVARAAGETPAEHARRLRTQGHGTLPLDLLAADVGLVRFAGVTLGPGEERKAVARAGRARRTLMLVPVEQPEAAPAGATAPTGPVVRGSRRSQGPGADMLASDDPGTLAAFLTRMRRGI